MGEEPPGANRGEREGEREKKEAASQPPEPESGEAPNSGEEEPVDVHLRTTFRHSVDEGVARLNRTWPDLLATGAIGGIDVSLGILALLLIEEATGSTLLGSLGFTIGFIALHLGKSELFTENFLVPVAALVAGECSPRALGRLWAGTAVLNLVAGWLFAWIIILAFPDLHETAVTVAEAYPFESLVELSALGLLAGAAITLMTWMEQGARSEFGKIVAVASIAFLLAAGPLNHVIVVSIEMFAAIHTGQAPFGYGEWARVAGIATVTNMIGGLLLVTVLRLVQLGMWEIRALRRRSKDRISIGD